MVVHVRKGVHITNASEVSVEKGKQCKLLGVVESLAQEEKIALKLMRGKEVLGSLVSHLVKPFAGL